MVTYERLFNYVGKQIHKRGCDNTLRHTKAFARRHQLDEGDLVERLNHAGGYCDCEVLLNAQDRIFGDEIIGHEIRLSIQECARTHDFYYRYLVDGEPIAIEDVRKALDGGKHIDRVACSLKDQFAVIDLNQTMGWMSQAGLFPA